MHSLKSGRSSADSPAFWAAASIELSRRTTDSATYGFIAGSRGFAVGLMTPATMPKAAASCATARPSNSIPACESAGSSLKNPLASAATIFPSTSRLSTAGSCRAFKSAGLASRTAVSMAASRFARSEVCSRSICAPSSLSFTTASTVVAGSLPPFLDWRLSASMASNIGCVGTEATRSAAFRLAQASAAAPVRSAAVGTL